MYFYYFKKAREKEKRVKQSQMLRVRVRVIPTLYRCILKCYFAVTLKIYGHSKLFVWMKTRRLPIRSWYFSTKQFELWRYAIRLCYRWTNLFIFLFNRNPFVFQVMSLPSPPPPNPCQIGVPIALDFLKWLHSLPPLFFQELNRYPSYFSFTLQAGQAPLCFVVCVSLAINTHFTRDLLLYWVPAFEMNDLGCAGGGALEISHLIFTSSLKSWKWEASLPYTLPTPPTSWFPADPESSPLPPVLLGLRHKTEPTTDYWILLFLRKNK